MVGLEDSKSNDGRGGGSFLCVDLGLCPGCGRRWWWCVGWSPVVCVGQLAEKRREESEGGDTVWRRLAGRRKDETRKKNEKRRRERNYKKVRVYFKGFGLHFGFRV